jgi:hypothetical protein
MKSALHNAELNGQSFDEAPTVRKFTQPTYVFTPIVADVEADLKVREARTIYGTTKAGEKIGFVMCASCDKHMMYCQCEYIKPPKNINYCTDPLVRF